MLNGTEGIITRESKLSDNTDKVKSDYVLFRKQNDSEMARYSTCQWIIYVRLPHAFSNGLFHAYFDYRVPV